MKEKDIFKKAIEENIANKEVIRQRVLIQGKNEDTEREKGFSTVMKRKYVAIPVTVCLVFGILVNTSSTFAYAMSSIPVIKDIARIVTFREYSNSTESNDIHVEIPKIENIGNTKLEEKINNTISTKIDELAKISEKEADEYRKNFLNMENGEENYKKTKIDFSYEVKSANDRIVSFIVTKKEVTTDEFTTLYMYNISIEDGKDITLESILGNNYKNIINEEIERQIIEKSKTDENLLSYYEKFYKSNGLGIDDNTKFYVNEKGNAVVVFEEYEIAPEYAGIQEFEIVK